VKVSWVVVTEVSAGKVEKGVVSVLEAFSESSLVEWDLTPVLLVATVMPQLYQLALLVLS
jgi:hypothetical protein